MPTFVVTSELLDHKIRIFAANPYKARELFIEKIKNESILNGLENDDTFDRLANANIALDIEVAENSGKAFLIYDTLLALDPNFIDDLNVALSKQLSVEEYDLAGGVMYSPDAVEWIEIALVFMSSTVATGFLTKIGEDIWDKLKLAAQKAEEKQKTQKRPTFRFDVDSHALGLTITIRAGDVRVQGHASPNGYEMLVKTMASVQQMITDAEKLLQESPEELKAMPIYHEYDDVIKDSPLFEYGLWFEYEFIDEKWILFDVTLYKDGGEKYIEV